MKMEDNYKSIGSSKSEDIDYIDDHSIEVNKIIDT